MRSHFFFLVFLLFIFLNYQSLCSAQNVELVIEPEIAWQGKVLTVKVLSAEGIARVKATFLDQKFDCYEDGDYFRGIVGIPTDQKPGFYDLKLIITRNDESTEIINREMKVWATKFPFSKYWLKPSKKKLLARDLINKEWAEIEKSLMVEYSDQLWMGTFSWPAEARISQAFGHRQIINGKRSGNHRGVDIAVPIGTEIKAPNQGKVVFSKKLKAFGGTMVLDHGQGIHTLYFHLSKFIAEVGEIVEQGDVLALSGNSGISSGPHLHWGMSVHNLRVDPMQWLKHQM
jgi:hypothetical protein